MPDEATPNAVPTRRKPLFTSYVFENPGSEVGGGAGNVVIFGGDPKDALYVVHTYPYEGPTIIDLNDPNE